MSNRFRFLCRAVAATLVGVLAVTAHGQGQVADNDQLTSPTFRTDVNYVRVDVFVTRDGEPVLSKNEIVGLTTDHVARC